MQAFMFTSLKNLNLSNSDHLPSLSLRLLGCRLIRLFCFFLIIFVLLIWLGLSCLLDNYVILDVELIVYVYDVDLNSFVCGFVMVLRNWPMIAFLVLRHHSLYVKELRRWRRVVHDMRRLNSLNALGLLRGKLLLISCHIHLWICPWALGSWILIWSRVNVLKRFLRNLLCIHLLTFWSLLYVSILWWNCLAVFVYLMLFSILWTTRYTHLLHNLLLLKSLLDKLIFEYCKLSCLVARL